MRHGQTARAIEKFNEGARIASRTANNSPFAITLRHRVAEERVRQGDFKGAFMTYQEIHQQSPSDERAHFYVIDLGLRMGNLNVALGDLDALIALYQTHNEPKKAVGVVEALSQSYPHERALILRLAQCYHAAGATDKAIEILDALAEVALSKNDKPMAIESIKQIIAMNPPRVEEYKTLLHQLGE